MNTMSTMSTMKRWNDQSLLPAWLKFGVLAVACGVLIVAAPVAAADEDDAAPVPSPASDESAEDEQAGHAAPPSLDDLLGIDEDEQDRSADEATRREHERELERRLAEERIADAFAEAIEKMGISADLLEERFDTGLGTQRLQEEILAKLTDLIEEAQQQQSSSSSSSSSSASAARDPQQTPGQQQGGSSESTGATDQRDGENTQEGDLPPGQHEEVNLVLEETRQEWGSLPERVREMLLQGRQEPFSGLYEQLTREYYRRLAED